MTLGGELSRRGTANSRAGKGRVSPGIVDCPGLSGELAIRIDERRRIARELHDGSSQLLVALQLRLASLRQQAMPGPAEESWAEIEQTIASLHREIRAIAAINPEPLSLPITLGDALAEMATSFGRLAGMKVAVEVSDMKVPLPPAVEVAFYRIAQEALANARRHGEAARVLIRLSASRRVLRMTVRDFGRGFARESVRGNGLANIRQRLSLLGGTLCIAHLLDGTLLTMSAPLLNAGGELGETLMFPLPAITHDAPKGKPLND